MKKAFLLFTMLILLSISTVFLGQQFLLSQKDEVKITENILFGDASVMEGVTLEMKNHYENQMFWDTWYRLGKEPMAKTEYTLYQSQQYEEEGRKTNSLIFSAENYMNWFWNESTEKTGMKKAVFELYDSLGAGEFGEKTIRMKDYIDNYAFTIDFSVFSEDENTGDLYLSMDAETLKQDLTYANSENILNIKKQLEWLKCFQEFFKIPVLDSQICNFAMQKDKNGEVSGWSVSTVDMGMSTGDIDFAQMPDIEENDAFSFDIKSSVENGDVYFTFYNKSYQGVTMDTGQISGGYGIYYFPYDMETSEIYPEQLRMVYALDPEIEVYDLTKDAGGKHLLLFTTEEDGVYLSVIEIATMTLKDKVLIDGTDDDDEFYGIDCYNIFENCVIVVTYDELVLISIDTDGTYEKAFGISRKQAEALNPDKSWNTQIFALDTAYAWDGEKLVFANHFYNVNGYMGTNFYVGAASKEGLLYFAEYKTSLSNSISKHENGYEIYNYAHCRPVVNGMHITITR